MEVKMLLPIYIYLIIPFIDLPTHPTFVSEVSNTGIADRGMSASQLTDVNYKIILYITHVRRQIRLYRHLLANDGNDLIIGNNHHYHKGGNPAVYYEGSNCAACDWDSHKGRKLWE